MLEYIKSINLCESIKTNDIYNLFKTDSFELNLNLLSSLQDFKTMNDFLNYYTKQDCKNAFNLFNNLFIISSKIYKENENNIYKSEIDNYLSYISKIIFLLSLIQKNNEILNNLLTNIKKVVKNYHKENRNNNNILEKINNCINDLLYSSQIVSQRNYSRRATKENTLNGSNLFNINNLGKNKQSDNNSNEEEYFLFQCSTPKFEEDDDQIDEVNEEQSCYNNIILENKNKDDNNKIDSKKTIKTIGSSLSFKYMKCVHDSDEENKRYIKKNKTVKMGIDFSTQKDFFKKKSISNIINDSFNDDLSSENENNPKTFEKSTIIAKFLNIINSLYKTGKITSQEKLAIKQLIISDSETIIQKYFQYNINNNNYDKDYKYEYIKQFLVEQIKLLK